jgi:hypothetical protein
MVIQSSLVCQIVSETFLNWHFFFYSAKMTQAILASTILGDAIHLQLAELFLG